MGYLFFWNKNELTFVKRFKNHLVKDLSTYDDMQLLEMSLKNNSLAFAEIVKRYKDVIATIIKSMLGNVAEAEDVGLEVFVRFYNSASSFRGDSSLKTYLTRIAINLSLNELKRRKKKRLMNIEDVKYAGAVDHISKNTDLKELIDKALEYLEPKFKSVLVLRLVEGYSTKEVGEILQLPQGTVLSRLSRAQEKLRKIILMLDK